jgi:hypothetical protein
MNAGPALFDREDVGEDVLQDAGVVIAYPGLWRATEEANGEEPVAAH